jgi:hypothetical protein
MNVAFAPLVRNFSSFGYLFSINESVSVDWIADPALKQLITNLVTTAPCPQPDAWARYFLLQVRAEDWITLIPLLHPDAWQHPVKAAIAHFAQINPIPNQPVQAIHAQLVVESHHPDIAPFLDAPTVYSQNLLIAYLQKPCWYAAKGFYDTKVALSSLHSRHSLEDCFQIAVEHISQPQRLLRAFRFEHEHTSVKTYAEKKLQGLLRRAIADTALDACSNWSLLRYLSRKELLEALTAKGLLKSQIDHHCLLWSCFQEVYQTQQIRQNQLPPPTEQQLEQMAQRYQHYHGKTEQSVSEGLSVCIQAVRAYRHPQAVLERAWQQSGDGELDPLAELIYQEEIHQVRMLLEQCLCEFSDTVRAIFYLWFGLEISLPEILEVIGSTTGLQNSQQLLRQIKNHRKHLLASFLKKLHQQQPDYFQDNPQKPLISQNALQALENALKRTCKQNLYDYLENQLQALSPQHRLILFLRYQEQLSMSDIETYTESSALDLLVQGEQIMTNLVGGLKQLLETDLKILDNHSRLIEDALTHFIHDWLNDRHSFELGGDFLPC